MNNNKNGYGKFITTDGVTIHCYAIDDVIAPTGCITYPNGDTYSGDIDNVNVTGDVWTKTITYSREGHGKCIYSNGIVYIGEWLNDKRHGQGYQKWPDGRTYSGEWSNDNIGVTLVSSNGHYTYPDGTSCDGIFVNGKLAVLQDIGQP